MKKEIRRPRSKWLRRSWMVLLCVLVCLTLMGGLVARYVMQRQFGLSSQTSTEFYFSTDLTGDPMMAKTGVLQGKTALWGYAESLEEEWTLYGGGSHSVEIQVRNYLDELRITEQNIDYQITMEDSVHASLTKAGETAEGTLAGSLTGERQQSDTWTLSIPGMTSGSYEAGTVITVTVTSTTPYQETIRLRFVLTDKIPAVHYQVTDQGSYYELTILNQGDVSAQGLQVVWPEELSIDRTNALTFTINGNSFEQMDAEYDPSDGTYRMTLSRAIQPWESVSIYFFQESDSGESLATEKTPAGTVKDGGRKLCLLLAEGQTSEGVTS